MPCRCTAIGGYSAPPDAEALAECPHYLYGHLGLRAPYSVGHWLDELREALGRLDGRRAIILGGTGLYFNALTKGLSTIPAIPDTVRAKADELAEREGVGVFARVLRDSDPATYAVLMCRTLPEPAEGGRF